jgi:ABC-type lipoprotein export system ATPase subunit
MSRKNNRDDGFSLLSFVSDELEIRFQSNLLQKKGVKVSLIIGPNGSGKSQLLAAVLDELTAIEDIRSQIIRDGKAIIPRGLTSSSEVKFRLRGSIFQFHRSGSDLVCYRNDKELAISESPFPRKAFAFAHLPVDRFRFSRNERDSFYSYFGLRQSTNLTTTGALETKVIFSLFHGFPNPKFISHISTWLNLLGLYRSMTLTLSDVDNKLLHSHNFKDFVEVANSLHRRRTGTMRDYDSGLDFERRIQDLDLVWKLLSHILPFAVIDNNKKTSFKLSLSSALFNDTFPPEFWEAALEAGRRTRIIGEMGLYFRKNNREIRFSNLSSGEQQILGTTVRLLSEIQQDSLVVIDEPEVSLHPAWQQRYVPTLLKTLEDFPSTHVLIATHSHFLVSDVDPNFSTLIISSVAEPRPKFEIFQGDVYGRSPENILYRAFGIGTGGNFFVERDLAKSLQIISGVVDFDPGELRDIYVRLLRVSDQNNEAFQLILKEIESHLVEDNYVGS